MPRRNRSVSLAAGLRYRGRAGMWTWILHRVTGLGILAFLIIHVIETAIVIWDPAFYDHALDLYKSPIFRVAELIIFFAVLYHAMNGLRIVIQDFWPRTMRVQKQLTVTAAVVVVLVMIPVTWIMMAPVFGLAEEPGTERHEERMERMQTEPTPAYEALYGTEVER